MKITVYRTHPTEQEKARGIVPAKKELILHGETEKAYPNLKRYGYGIEGGISDDACVYEIEGGVIIIE